MIGLALDFFDVQPKWGSLSNVKSGVRNLMIYNKPSIDS